MKYRIYMNIDGNGNEIAGRTYNDFNKATAERTALMNAARKNGFDVSYSVKKLFDVKIPVLFGVIAHNRNEEILVEDGLVSSELLWNYYHNCTTEIRRRVFNIAKDYVGIDRDEPAYVGLFVEYLINPETEIVDCGDDNETVEKFYDILDKRKEEFLNA